jgi:hypothetical protein
VGEVKAQDTASSHRYGLLALPVGRLSSPFGLAQLELEDLVAGRTPKNAGIAVSEIRPFLRLRSQVKTPVKDSV